MSDEVLLAHSAALPERPAQPYRDHIEGVVRCAGEHVNVMLAVAGRTETEEGVALANAVEDAALFHDLGKLEAENQQVLRGERKCRYGLPIDHIDAGIAHLMGQDAWTAAWLVRAHHKPGLPYAILSRGGMTSIPPLRGGRRFRYQEEDQPDSAVAALIEATNRRLPVLLARHEAVLGRHEVRPYRKRSKGLALRLALSCMVDADHTDSAGGPQEAPAAPRWAERLAALDAYVAGLPPSDNPTRNHNRAVFYRVCREGLLDEPMVACEGPVGIGKTTAVMAFALRQALARGLRHVFVIAPYTNIITQTVRCLRAALTLAGEQDEIVVAEHHHRADFDSLGSRELTVRWQAPVIVTTAVQFFETLAANTPASLRKLHQLPGSVIVIDEAHAVLPAPLIPQNYAWLDELTTRWGCRVVFSSGSLVRFWEHKHVASSPGPLPELLPSELGERFLQAEQRRIRYVSLGGAVRVLSTLVERILAEPGPRLMILNTVQSAAVVARELVKVAGAGQVEHVSTALTPADRERVLDRITARLKAGNSTDWTLVATSCVEAGVDFSFRSGFRERFSVTSLIQVGGRVNRNAEYDAAGGGVVFDFVLDTENGICAHPAALKGAEIVEDFFQRGVFETGNPAELATQAMNREFSCLGRGAAGVQIGKRTPAQHNPLSIAELSEHYPEVAKQGRVIDNDSRLVVVDEALKAALKNGEKVSFQQLLRGSVQMYAYKIAAWQLEKIGRHEEIYSWPHEYDPECFGFMAGCMDLMDKEKDGFIF